VPDELPLPRIDLSVHRFERGERLPLGQARLIALKRELYVQVEDEEQLSLDTPDGGGGWLVHAGPAGAGRDTDWALLDLEVSPQVAEFVHDYAHNGKFVVAQWKVVDSPVFAWDAEMLKIRRREAAKGRHPLLPDEVRSIPLAVFATTSEATSTAPREWPNPIVCETARELFEELQER
jgi:hypothetical protein